MHKWFGVSALVVILDQLTKYIVQTTFTLHESIAVTPFFNLVFVFNRGAAFSFLSDADGWQRGLFITLAIGASVWIVWLLRKHSTEILFCLALSLILGGAIGNVIDRLIYGAVIDFLDFHAFGYHWPVFNVADTAISCGAALLVWEALTSKRKPAPA